MSLTPGLTFAAICRPRRIERAILLANFEQRRTDEEQIERIVVSTYPATGTYSIMGETGTACRGRFVVLVTVGIKYNRARGRDAVRRAMKHVFHNRTRSLSKTPMSVLVPGVAHSELFTIDYNN